VPNFVRRNDARPVPPPKKLGSKLSKHVSAKSIVSGQVYLEKGSTKKVAREELGSR